jgi:hypothetical protein
LFSKLTFEDSPFLGPWIADLPNYTDHQLSNVESDVGCGEAVAEIPQVGVEVIVAAISQDLAHLGASEQVLLGRAKEI